MKAKKYRHADLERKRSIFFQIGLIVALGASLAAFEWGSPAKGMKQVVIDDQFVEIEDMMPITQPEEPKKELPKPIAIEQIEVVDNTEDTPVDLDNFSSDIEDHVYEIPDMPVEEDEAPVTFIHVEHMPEFPGGQAALLKYIAGNVKYPVICAESGITGRVYISFVINEQGDVVEAKVVRSPDKKLSAEALRVVNNMPKWTPGFQRDKAVRVAYTIPVNFVLQ
ncbi:energy transducer TonB [Carboxylicivirga sp. RSCT41]|uniref:energy transducer TonB n=1 Tax=Carboxylicivirga agarovorans TaxID=3417570 RepID=UPI003D3485FE